MKYRLQILLQEDNGETNELIDGIEFELKPGMTQKSAEVFLMSLKDSLPDFCWELKR